jgi:multidrug transporter EmrE-like cation transporter
MGRGYIFCATCCSTCWSPSDAVLLLRRTFAIKGMAIVNTLWSALSIMTVAGVGYFYFDEPLTRWEIIAVGLATVAAAIMAR